MQDKGIAVFYIGQDDLFDLLATSLVSICYNTKSLVNFYILDCGVSDFNKKQLEKLKTRFDNFTIEYLPVDLTIFSGIQKYKGFSDFWAKLLIPQIKPEVEKAIYLDTDTIALADIQEFWAQDLGQYALGAVPATYYDQRRDATFRRLYPLGKNFLFINTGALLIDCVKWRADHIFEKLMALIKKYNNVLDQAVGYDEIICSLYFENNFKILDCRYNMTDHENTLKEFNSKYTDAYVNDEWKHVVIRHFAGTDKPWVELRNDYNGQILKNLQAFWFFAQMTAGGTGLWVRYQEATAKKICRQKMFNLTAVNDSGTRKIKRKYFLFGFIPFMKSIITTNKKSYKLFNSVPFWVVKKKRKKVRYKLFGFLPLLKIKEK